jgi:hypothetical protein
MIKKGVDNLYRVALNNQAKDNPDFMLTLGDIFGDKLCLEGVILHK